MTVYPLLVVPTSVSAMDSECEGHEVWTVAELHSKKLAEDCARSWNATELAHPVGLRTEVRAVRLSGTAEAIGFDELDPLLADVIQGWHSVPEAVKFQLRAAVRRGIGTAIAQCRSKVGPQLEPVLDGTGNAQ